MRKREIDRERGCEKERVRNRERVRKRESVCVCVFTCVCLMQIDTNRWYERYATGRDGETEALPKEGEEEVKKVTDIG